MPSISGLLNLLLDLHFHHNIEEHHIFPVLAQRMPEFAKQTGEHIKERTSFPDPILSFLSDSLRTYLQPLPLSSQRKKEVSTRAKSPAFFNTRRRTDSCRSRCIHGLHRNLREGQLFLLAREDEGCNG